MTKEKEKPTTIFIVSGGKGVAGHTMLHSLLIQYPNNKLKVKIIPNVQSYQKIHKVVACIKKENGLLVHTLVNSPLRQLLLEECIMQGVNQIDFMGPMANYLEEELGFESVNVPGLYRRINAQYFNRIEAIEYTLNHDDGLNTARLNKAEIILTGVSRSGKTPLSVYMSMFGWRVANVPLIAGISTPKELFEVDPRRVFGLSIAPNQLISQRKNRLAQMGNLDNQNYVDINEIRKEIKNANFVFERGKFTRINVTNKPIETSANEIIGLISERFGYEERKKTPGV